MSDHLDKPLKDSAVLSDISKAKAKEESPDGMAIRAATRAGTSTSPLAIIAEVNLLVPAKGRARLM